METETLKGSVALWPERVERYGTYTIPSRCVNCGHEAVIERFKGRPTYSDKPECPNCGCDMWLDLIGLNAVVAVLGNGANRKITNECACGMPMDANGCPNGH